jgi:tetratricopeptide (TPR) repeat protein
MAIKGSLREASLPDVLQLLAMGQKTGCLSVTHRSSFGSIYFDRGRISYAAIVNRRDRLGDILVKSGLVAREALEEAIAQQEKHRDVRLGDILVNRGVIGREELHRQVRLQIEEAVYHLFTWSDGTFNFEPEMAPEEQDFLVSINPESLLLEGARRVDEWSLIEKKIPSFDLVFSADGALLAEKQPELTPEQELLLPLIDGRRDVQALVDASGLTDFDAGKALYGLATAGFLHRVGKSRPTEQPRVAEVRVEEHRNLGVAFYKTGMYDEAMREFRRVMDLRPEDVAARFHVGLVLMRQGRWDEAAQTFAAASRHPGALPPLFHNLAYALERLGRLDEAWSALDEAIRRGGEHDPRVQMSRGVLALRRGEVADAAALLDGARVHFGKRTPPATWFHYAALATALGGDLTRARELLEEGAQAHPHAAPLHNNLAAVRERVGDVAGALAAAERGLLEDASLAQLHKNVGDLHYRAGRYDEALEAYQRAVRANANLGDDVYLKLGNLRFRRQEAAEAERCWQRALELDPTNAIVRNNLDAVRRVGAA